MHCACLLLTGLYVQVLLDKGVDEGTIRFFIGSAAPSLDLCRLSALSHS